MSYEIITGDCLSLMRGLRAGSIDLILCDLPYGTTDCKWDAVIPFGSLWECYARIAKPHCPIVLTASQPFTSALVMSNPKMFRHGWIYQKRCASNFAQAKIAPMKEHEDVLVFSKETANYYPIKEPRKGSGGARVKNQFSAATRHKSGEVVAKFVRGEFNPVADDLRFPSSVREFNNRAKGDRGLHPTQKPVALMRYLVETYSRPGDTVLDNCCGSGTTGVACISTGRDFVGIESKTKYAVIARERCEEAVLEREQIARQPKPKQGSLLDAAGKPCGMSAGSAGAPQDLAEESEEER